jgi:hypothetical protein
VKLNVESAKKKRHFYGQRLKTNRIPRTVIDFTSVRELIRFTERMHKIRQTCGIEMRGMLGK